MKQMIMPQLVQHKSGSAKSLGCDSDLVRADRGSIGPMQPMLICVTHVNFDTRPAHARLPPALVAAPGTVLALSLYRHNF